MKALLATLLVLFSPHGGCRDEIVKQLGKAKATVLVQAYSLTAPPIVQALIAARGRGVDVEVILDKAWQTESPAAEAALVAAKVPVLIDGAHAIAHNKVMVIDGAVVITGSYNFTGQAETSNAENLLVISGAEGRKAAALYTANWKAHAAHSKPPTVPVNSPSPATPEANPSSVTVPPNG